MAQAKPVTWKDWISNAGLDEDLSALASPDIYEPNDDDRKAAWILYTELSTRVSVAPLKYKEGDEVTALTSLYTVFTKSRELIAEHGRSAHHFATVTRQMFEQHVRPFTGYWHGKKEDGSLANHDTRREFRQRLRALQPKMERFANLLQLLSDSQTKFSSVGSQETGDLWPDKNVRPDVYLGSINENFPADIQLEHAQIEARRANVKINPDIGLVGLSLSGGGIRSATFCLGVVQTLVEKGVFEAVDYLSTVSGGGYLGGFLTASLNPDPGRNVKANALLVEPAPGTGDSTYVRWLRNNSKYLIGHNREEKRATRRELLRVFFGPRTLHEYYRDKLANTYLKENADQPNIKMSQLARLDSAAPYPIINAAINLPGSEDKELRGRDSDFFAITPHYMGSVTTGYCKSEAMEEVCKEIDLAGAVATSGAAISPHMGMKTKRPVSKLMSTLNLRLGMWVPNPKMIAAGETPGRLSRMRGKYREFRGKLDETADHVNLADGGFVENLGVYELLRRRCNFIIAVDGECDEGRTCAALTKAIRLAKIDFGVEIEIDFSALHIDDDGLSQAHFAFGEIEYPEGQTGYLLYVKSSVTGNESSYIDEYRQQHPTFPHQTTADQLFDEEQFEAYRALGQHAMGDLFTAELAPDHTRLTVDSWVNQLIKELIPEARGSKP